MTAAEAALRLRAVSRRMQDQAIFFNSVAGKYLQMVRGATDSFLQGQRPGSVAAKQWASAVATFTRLITVEVTPKGGMVLRFEQRVVSLAPGMVNAVTGMGTLITRENIRAWIVAGQQGEALGKDLTRADAALGVEQLTDKLYSLVHGLAAGVGGRSDPDPKFDGLRAAIVRWLQGGSAGANGIGFGPHYAGILRLWKRTLTPVYRQDLRDFVKRSF